MKSVRGFIDGEYQDGELRGRMFLAGTSGYGKTTEGIRLCSQSTGIVVMWDAQCQHSLPGAVHLHQPGQLKAALLTAVKRNKATRIVYQPMIGDLSTHFRSVCRIVGLIASLVLFVDEIDEMCDSKWGQSRMPPELYKLVHHGRHAPWMKGAKRRAVALMYTSRVPTSVARGLTSQASEVRVFHEHEPSYVKYWEKAIGVAIASKLATLPKYKYWRWFKDGREPQLCGGRR